jgi:hypothetical protein
MSSNRLISGYLHTSKQLRNKELEAFEKRFFVLYPYCGLQWFIREPEDAVLDDLYEIVGRKEDINANARGWVFGGNISVNEISVNEVMEVIEGEGGEGIIKVYFPFTLKLVCSQVKLTVKLAAETVEAMNMWIDGIKNTCSNINLVRCFASANCFPSPDLYAVGLTAEAVQFSNCRLDSTSMQALATMATQNSDMISSVSLFNCQLRDHHVRMISSFIDCELLLRFTLSNNFITDVGATELSQVLIHCKRLQSFDVSCNFIGDLGMERLSESLSECCDLRSINIARNHLTERSVRPLTKYFAKFSSKLEHLDISYNQLGEGAAMLVSLLLKNKSSPLRHFDISFCRVGDAGLKELVAPIATNRILRTVNIKGNFMDAAVLIPFVEAVGSCHKRTSRLPSSDVDDANFGLVVKMGSLSLQGNRVCSLSYKATKSALPYVDDCTLLVNGCIRRRLQSPLLTSGATSVSVKETGKVPVDRKDALCVVSVQFEATALIKCVEDLVVHLSCLLGADPCQFSVLSCSVDDNLVRDSSKVRIHLPDEEADSGTAATSTLPNGRLCMATLLFQGASEANQRLHKYRLFPKIISKNSTETIQNLLQWTGSSRSNLPDVEFVFHTLTKWSSCSHPALRSERIRSVFAQLSHVGIGSTEVRLSHPPISADLLIPVTENGRIHCNISKSGILGRGSLDDFVPLLSPTDYNKLFEGSGYSGSAGDIQLQYNYDVWRRLAQNDDGIATKYMKEVGGLLFGDEENEDSESEAYSSLLLRRSKENAIARGHARKERRAKSEELIAAVRDLRKTNHLDSATAKFWEAALGNVRYRYIKIVTATI